MFRKLTIGCGFVSLLVPIILDILELRIMLLVFFIIKLNSFLVCKKYLFLF
jgi:hypothetical protein